MAKSPLEQVKEKFGDKSKLVTAIRQLSGEELWLTRDKEGKGLDHVSNAKLLKLHATFSLVKEGFGTRAKLASAVAELEGRGKDEGYSKRLSAWPVPRLYDHFKSTKRRLDAAKKAAEAKAAPPEAKPAAAKAAAKKAAPAKPAAAKPAAKKAPAKAAAKKKGKLGPSGPAVNDPAGLVTNGEVGRARPGVGRATRRPPYGPSTSA